MLGNIIFILIFSLLFISNQSAATESENNTITKAGSFERGITVAYNYKDTEFIIAGVYTGQERAKFKQNVYSSFFELSSGDFFNNTKRLSFFIRLGYGEFELTQQTSVGDKTNFGTSVQGRYTYLMPMLYYNFNSTIDDLNRYKGLRLGGGIGIGHLSAVGTAVFTNTGNTVHNQVYANSSTVVNIVEISYQYSGFVTGVKIVGMYSKSFFSRNEEKNNFLVNETIFHVGYLIHF